jgi:hypothetical protein
VTTATLSIDAFPSDRRRVFDAVSIAVCRKLSREGKKSSEMAAAELSMLKVGSANGGQDLGFVFSSAFSARPKHYKAP